MSSAAKKIALVALGGAGAAFAIKASQRDKALQPQVKEPYNDTVHAEQDRRDTIFDRTQLMNDAKHRKPWNMTYAEKQRIAQHE